MTDSQPHKTGNYIPGRGWGVGWLGGNKITRFVKFFFGGGGRSGGKLFPDFVGKERENRKRGPCWGTEGALPGDEEVFAGLT